jgi:hypothetical protein
VYISLSLSGSRFASRAVGRQDGPTGDTFFCAPGDETLARARTDSSPVAEAMKAVVVLVSSFGTTKSVYNIVMDAALLGSSVARSSP